MVEIQVTGLKELREKLLGLTPKLGGEILASALGSATTVIKSDAKRRAPLAEKSYWLNLGSGQKALAYRGWLRDQIIQKRTSSTRTRAESIVTVRKAKGASRPAFFWAFIEYGHFARKSKPVRGSARALRSKEGGDVWIPAHPFMRPAFSSQQQAAIKKFSEKMKMKIDKENGK